MKNVEITKFTVHQFCSDCSVVDFCGLWLTFSKSSKLQHSERNPGHKWEQTGDTFRTKMRSSQTELVQVLRVTTIPWRGLYQVEVNFTAFLTLFANTKINLWVLWLLWESPRRWCHFFGD